MDTDKYLKINLGGKFYTHTTLSGVLQRLSWQQLITIINNLITSLVNKPDNTNVNGYIVIL